MKKKYFNSLKKYTIGAIAAVSIAACAITPSLINQKSNSAQVTDDALSTSKKQVDEQNTNIVEVLTPDSKGLSEEQVNKVRNLYSLKPSNILTNISAGNGVDDSVANGGADGTDWPSNSIFNILNFNSKFLSADIVKPGNGNTSPQVFNLASIDTYNSAANSTSNLVKSEELPAFSVSNTAENASSLVISQDYLDSIGVLPLEIVFYTKTGSAYAQYVMYIMISGFGSKLSANDLSSNPVLQSSAYTQMVNQITNEQLVEFPKFSDSSILPDKKNLVNESRVDDMSSGTVSFDLNFSWTMPNDFSFSSSYSGITPSSQPSSLTNTNVSYSSSVSNESISTSYTQNFKYSGFQPSPNTSTEEVIYILIAIVVGTAIIVFIVYFLSIFVLRRIREKRAV